MADEVKPPFWLVWSRYGRSPVCEHESYFSARNEAERLSKANPGREFYVLSPVARGVLDGNPVWSHYTDTGIATVDDLAEHNPRFEEHDHG